MPGRADCSHCPFRDDAETPCAAIQLDSARWCHATNFRLAIWKPSAVDELRRVTFEMLGRPAPDDPPPLAAQAKTLARAVVRFVGSGLERSTSAQRAERLAVCGGCEFFAGGRCRKCGCALARKVAMASEHCPIDKW